MYSFKEILNNICKTREGTTNIKQSYVMIPQRGLRSCEPMDHPELPLRMTSIRDANDSTRGREISGDCGSLSHSFNEQLIEIRMPSRGNGQQLPRNFTGQKAKETLNAEVDFRPPFPACQLDNLSGSSEIMPLYRLSSNNEGALSHHSSYHEATSPMSNLDPLMVTAIGSAVENAKTDTQPRVTYRGNRFQGFQTETLVHTQSCPNACPCVCHLQSPFPVLNGERPSVIMAPVARNYRASSVSHIPLQDKREVSRDSDEKEHLFRVDINGVKAKFTLTEHDWNLMAVNHFPSGGRLLGGAWTSIFRRGVQESNPWCKLRFKNNHVRTKNSRKIRSAPFFRGAAECKNRECAVKLKFVIKEERGKYVSVTYVGKVCHKI